jgi:HEAT repeat protein
MWVLHAVFLFLMQQVWRWTGSSAAARSLVRALGSPNPNIRSIAGIFLVRTGGRAAPYLEESLKRRENLPMVLAILADIGDLNIEPELQQFTEDRDPQVATAARNALRVLAAHR